MIASYSSFDKFEIPNLTLCNPGSIYNNGTLTHIVGMLTGVSDMEIVFNFTPQSELNFRITRLKHPDPDINTHMYNMYKSIQNRRLIFVENVGYFIINNITEGINSNGQYKDVSCLSMESELEQRMIPYIANGTYRFSTDAMSQKRGLLETVVQTLPNWTIGFVDTNVASKFRTFEDIDTSTNCLAFMLDNMQDAYECIFVFDIINRIINVYDQNNYVQETGIHLSKNDVINSIDITENADDVYTAISVLGDDEVVMISPINPLGTNKIYDFTYYLSWMSASLRENVLNWQEELDDMLPEYYDLNLEYYQTLESANNHQLEIQRLEIQLTMYQRCRDNIIAEASTSMVEGYNTAIINNGGTPITVYPEISATLLEIDNLIIETQSLKDIEQLELNDDNESIASIRIQTGDIHDRLAIENYFSEEHLAELNNYIFECEYNDEYIIITDQMNYEERFEQMKILYDRAKTQLEKISRPTQEFNISTENFIFDKAFADWTDQLETGCLINVELEEDDIAMLFLTSMTVNYEDKSISFTFGNRFNKFDTRSLFENVLGSVNKTANTMNYVKDILYPIKNGELNKMQEAINSSRTFSAQQALASQNENIVIDDSGITAKRKLSNGSYDPKQLKINSGNIVLTDDNWQSAKVAIGEMLLGDESIYGVNAETIIGNLIMGNNLRILDNNGNDLLTVVDGKIATNIQALDGRMSQIEQTAEGVDVRVSELENRGAPNEITTATGYKFNSNGLNIHKDGEEMTNLLNNKGMYVMKDDEDILVADNNGVDAINLTARQYLIVGDNARFENYETNRTACFYTG